MCDLNCSKIKKQIYLYQKSAKLIYFKVLYINKSNEQDKYKASDQQYLTNLDGLSEIRDHFWNFTFKAVKEDESWKSRIVKEDILTFTLEKNIRIRVLNSVFTSIKYMISLEKNQVQWPIKIL